MNDPFETLGLDRSSSADDVRRARRDLAKRAHPDAGGDEDRMQQINAAAAAALLELTTQRRDRSVEESADLQRPDSPSRDGSDGRRTDVPSFTVEALPVETFEALLLAAAVLGEVEDDDPPYELGVLMTDPLRCWCRLSVVPDAGASTVSLAIAPAGGELPSLESIRDAWITQLNALDWSDL